MQWAPRPVETAVAAVGALIAVALAVNSDSAGRLLFGIGALCLAGLVAADLVLRPRLRADADTVEVRTLAVRRRLPWSAVARVRVDEHSRYGLLSRTLEVDTGDALVVLGRRSLGADPREVAEALRQLRTEPFR
jgi:Bacterial PH domain